MDNLNVNLNVNVTTQTYNNNKYNCKCNYNAPRKTKLKVLTGTALSTGLGILHIMKKQNTNKLSGMEIGIKEGVLLCLASTFGGLITGLLFDKDEDKNKDKNNRKSKLKDGVNQVIGNTFVPYSCLAMVNKLTKGLPKGIRTISAVGTLMGSTFLGHKIANKVNEKVFHEESGYTCSLKDFATDFDDVFFAASTVLKNKALYKLTASLSPFTYLTFGFLAGTRQSDSDDDNDNNKNNTLDKCANILDTYG